MDNVSVIVPIYNAESTIERCVNSILNQSYKNFELILIDDGSTDNSLKVIINNYKNIKNIKIITQKNIGVARTRNKGIKIAKGKYIMFIDNDDFIDIDYIEKHVDKIKKGFDVVISGYRRVDEENRILCEKKLKNSFWSRYIIITPWARIFKRNFLLKNNIQFLNYDIGEDIYFNLSLYSFSPKVGILNYVGYNWFYNNLSISNTKHKGLNNNVDN